MLEEIVTYITHLIIAVISGLGYGGVFFLMTAESVLIPIPSEVTMTFAGYLASTGRFNLILLIIVGALANLFGSILAYGLGYWGEEHVVREWIKKYGKWLLISEHEFDVSQKWFKKYGEGIVFISRVLPIVRTFISLPAGIYEMSFLKFSLFTFLGSLIWSGILAYIGYVLGENWHQLEVYYRKFEYLILFLLLGLILFYVRKKLEERDI